jgi:hypothetical protein
MKKFDLSAARRRNTIAELMQQMRQAQRMARVRERRVLTGLDINEQRKPLMRVDRVCPRIGVWRGGC